MKLDIVGRRKIWFSISIALMAIALIASFFPGPKLDVQFSGGTIITYSYDGAIDKAEFTDAISQTIGQGVSVQEQSDVATGKMNYVVTLSSKNGISPEKQMELNDALTAKYPDQHVDAASVSNVDPVIGRDFLIKSLVAVAVASIIMIIYIAFRFRKMNGFSAGVISVMALLHDVVIVYATFVIFGIPLNDSFIAVILTILGYSINNTIIIYDRIRENRRLLPSKTSFKELVNTSVGQSMTRSINTTVSTVLAMLVVCIMSVIYHVNSIMTFAFPLLVGMLAGFFSSVFISGPLWGWWQERKLQQARGGKPASAN